MWPVGDPVANPTGPPPPPQPPLVILIDWLFIHRWADSVTLYMCAVCIIYTHTIYIYMSTHLYIEFYLIMLQRLGLKKIQLIFFSIPSFHLRVLLDRHNIYYILHKNFVVACARWRFPLSPLALRVNIISNETWVYIIFMRFKYNILTFTVKFFKTTIIII